MEEGTGRKSHPGNHHDGTTWTGRSRVAAAGRSMGSVCLPWNPALPRHLQGTPLGFQCNDQSARGFTRATFPTGHHHPAPNRLALPFARRRRPLCTSTTRRKESRHNRNRLDAGRRPANPLHLLAGRLRGGLPLLRHRPTRPGPQSNCRGNRRTGAGRSRRAQRGVAPPHQRRPDGSGRTTPQLRCHAQSRAAAQRPQSHGDSAAAHHPFHLRHRAGHRKDEAGGNPAQTRHLAQRLEQRAALGNHPHQPQVEH